LPFKAEVSVMLVLGCVILSKH